MAVADYFGLHGFPDPCWYQAPEAVLVFTLLTSTGSRVLASANIKNIHSALKLTDRKEQVQMQNRNLKMNKNPRIKALDGPSTVLVTDTLVC